MSSIIKSAIHYSIVAFVAYVAYSASLLMLETSGRYIHSSGFYSPVHDDDCTRLPDVPTLMVELAKTVCFHVSIVDVLFILCAPRLWI